MKWETAPPGLGGFKANHSGSEEAMLPAFPKGTIVSLAERSDFIKPNGKVTEGKKTCGRQPSLKIEGYKFADLTPRQSAVPIWIFVYDKATGICHTIIKTTYGEVAFFVPEASKELGRQKIKLGARDDTRLTGRIKRDGTIQFPQSRAQAIG